MDIKIIHHTLDRYAIEKGDTEYSVEAAMRLAGREAGICYMADDYFSEAIGDDETAIKRAKAIIKTGHHSPFDHISIGVEISGIPKIMAMILNSTEMYTTSEKSARYTKMTSNDLKETELYNKWRDIFNKIIPAKYPEIDAKTVDKLAMENARYMLSVFTPTSMGFTTSFRQFSYLYHWLNDLAKDIEDNILSDNIPTYSQKTDYEKNFYKKIKEYSLELADKIYPITNGIIDNHKGAKLRFMPDVTNHYSPYASSIDGYEAKGSTVGDSYEIEYLCSFACLAQAQRHRTLHYEMSLRDELIYTPAMLYAHNIYNDILEYTDRDLVREWKEDMMSIIGNYPQGTLVSVYESGSAYNFFLKCKERLCGRAQLEICKLTSDAMKVFIRSKDRLSKKNIELLDECAPDGEVVPKCGMCGYKCKEPCTFGKNGITRII